MPKCAFTHLVSQNSKATLKTKYFNDGD